MYFGLWGFGDVGDRFGFWWFVFICGCWEGFFLFFSGRGGFGIVLVVVG